MFISNIRKKLFTVRLPRKPVDTPCLEAFKVQPGLDLQQPGLVEAVSAQGRGGHMQRGVGTKWFLSFITT